eukprot:CAMPEP_0170057646 /NCGR_PEP_ID=MMETSP0019_2-20121128/566_1 /TAXON_ID=98059 /ORGANISM="Dinobryon sp., Strain UTEXLB2267" /LENGTH=601 /DNA_ID=CAMNT_0010262389 /DNA_START=123 /DNA_END=1928 /DNA_ORIENTATION=+
MSFFGKESNTTRKNIFQVDAFDDGARESSSGERWGGNRKSKKNYFSSCEDESEILSNQLQCSREKPNIDQYQNATERSNLFFGRPSKQIKRFPDDLEISNATDENEMCSKNSTTSRADSFFSTQPKPTTVKSTVSCDGDYRGDENRHFNVREDAQYSLSKNNMKLQSEYSNRTMHTDNIVPNSQSPSSDKSSDSMSSVSNNNCGESLGNSIDGHSKSDSDKAPSTSAIFRRTVSPFTTSRKFTLESRWSAAIAPKRQQLDDDHSGSEHPISVNASPHSQLLESQCLDHSNSNCINDKSSDSQTYYDDAQRGPSLSVKYGQQTPQRFPQQQQSATEHHQPHQQQFPPQQLQPRLEQRNFDKASLSERKQQQQSLSIPATQKLGAKLPLFSRKEIRPSFQKSDSSPHFKRNVGIQEQEQQRTHSVASSVDNLSAVVENNDGALLCQDTVRIPTSMEKPLQSNTPSPTDKKVDSSVYTTSTTINSKYSHSGKINFADELSLVDATSPMSDQDYQCDVVQECKVLDEKIQRLYEGMESGKSLIQNELRAHIVLSEKLALLTCRVLEEDGIFTAGPNLLELVATVASHRQRISGLRLASSPSPTIS